MEELLVEAVEFKNIEAKKAFNRDWAVKFTNFLAGKRLFWAYKTDNSYSKASVTCIKVYVGANSGDLFVKANREITNRKDYCSINEFKEFGFKKPHLEAEDADTNLQILSLLEAYRIDYNDKAKKSNGLIRGEAGRVARAKRTADAVLQSPRCEELKDWLRQHVTGMFFRLPICSDPGKIALDDTLDVDTFERIAERWQYAAEKFLDLWKPALVEGQDFEYRDANKEPEGTAINYGHRGPLCIIHFDINLESPEVPDEINELFFLAKKEAEAVNTTNKPTNFDIKGKVLISYFAGRAFGEIFNYDITFYKQPVQAKAPVQPAAPAAELTPEEVAAGDEVFKQDFDSINAYGEKVESLREAKEEICCICGEPIEGYGNNPEPYKHEGRCCDACNMKFVIPARLAALNNKE